MQKLLIIESYNKSSKMEELEKSLEEGWKVVEMQSVKLDSSSKEELYIILEKETRKEKLEHLKDITNNEVQ